jgi:hypothetical protein
MLLITIFVEHRVVAGRSRKRAGSPQAASRRPCCTVALRRTAWSENVMGAAWAWHGHGMASVNQTRPHCVNQMGNTHSKPLAARHGRGTAWARHAMCESAFMLHYAYDNLDFRSVFFISYSRKETFRKLDIQPSSDGEDREIQDYRSQLVASATHFSSIRN